MKNKLLVLILILILSIPLVACGSDKKAEKSVKERLKQYNRLKKNLK
ncbi:hypothetical protein [Vallitalea maricola]|uniref:Uncharacterized protein n=1 Tax=Vallitalea maricola TaxID=3074433 RepID=A0ACB5UL29_9FIRM|nr:hypothetical protein AN2V17_28900 [Vallitalea sp. AN17-2]